MRSTILTKELLDLKDRFLDLDTQQQALFLDLVDPQPEPLVTTKMAVKKRKPRTVRSPRAESLATAIGGAVGQSRATSEPLCATCGNVENYEDHAQPSPHYHPFAPPAQSVRSQSSRNGERVSSVVTSETPQGDAGTALHAASEGASGD